MKGVSLRVKLVFADEIAIANKLKMTMSMMVPFYLVAVVGLGRRLVG